MVDSDDCIKRLERIIQEVQVRDDDETNRQKTADSKLTSALAVLPIIITLATTAFLQLLPYTKVLGRLGFLILSGFVVAVLLFVAAASFAIVGLWPMRARYSAIGLKTLSAFERDGTYGDLLRKVIEEKASAVRSNSEVNSRKLGEYAQAARLTVFGLGVLTLIVIVLSASFAIAPPSITVSAAPQNVAINQCNRGGNTNGAAVGSIGMVPSEINGILVVRLVLPNHSGERAGLRQGDRILSIAGERLSSATDANMMIGSAPVNSSVKVSVMRNGSRRSFDPVVELSCIP